MKDFTHGLVVVDPLEEGDYKTVLHFVGYWEEPGITHANNLREELRDDPEFGLQEIWERLEILPADNDIVKDYLDMCKNDPDNEDFVF
jgi:hypothetical protein